MTNRPILFSGPMVRAILAGTKTQTRRMACKGMIPPQYVTAVQYEPARWRLFDAETPHSSCNQYTLPLCPYGQPGDRLWVRESHAIVPRTAYAMSDGVQQILRPDDDHDAAIYREGWGRSTGGFRWRPSIHMPRWASRITLEITGVRVERLGSISAADAKAEGIEGQTECGPWRNYARDGYWFPEGKDAAPQLSFASLWHSINGADSWQANPLVWVVEFKRLED